MADDSPVAVAFHWTANSEHLTQWLVNVSAFGVEGWMIGTGVEELAARHGVNHADHWGHLPLDLPLVVLAPKTARDVTPRVCLLDFEHPKRALYYFGPDFTWLDGGVLGHPSLHEIVWVPNCSFAARDELYSFAIGAIVLYDRVAKESARC